MASERARGIQVHRPIIYGSTARLLTPEERALAPPDHTHRWTVFITSAAPIKDVKGKRPAHPSGEAEAGSGGGTGSRASVGAGAGGGAPGTGDEDPSLDLDHLPGGGDDLSYLIKKVTFRLHDTYPNPSRVIDKPPFKVIETGWGEFAVPIRIQFVPEASEKPLQLSHNIKLHHWGAPIEAAPLPPLVPASGEELGTEQQGEEGVADVTATATATDEEGVKTESMTPAPAATASPAVEAQASGRAEAEKEGDGDVEMNESDGAAVEKSAGAGAGSATPAPNPEDTTTPAEGTAPATAGDTPAPAPEAASAIAPAPAPSTVTAIPAAMPLSIAARYPVHAWQYDELVFSDPPQSFLNILNAHTPSALPARGGRPRDQREAHEEGKRRKTGHSKVAHTPAPAPAPTARAGSLRARPSAAGVDGAAGAAAASEGEAGGLKMDDLIKVTEKDRMGIPGEPGSADVPLEFSAEMERAEWNRLDDARRRVIEEMDRWREVLIAKEREVGRMKEELGVGLVLGGRRK